MPDSDDDFLESLQQNAKTNIKENERRQQEVLERQKYERKKA